MIQFNLSKVLNTFHPLMRSFSEGTIEKVTKFATVSFYEKIYGYSSHSSIFIQREGRSQGIILEEGPWDPWVFPPISYTIRLAVRPDNRRISWSMGEDSENSTPITTHSISEEQFNALFNGGEANPESLAKLFEKCRNLSAPAVTR